MGKKRIKMKRSAILQSLRTALLGLFVTFAGAGCGGKGLYPVKVEKPLE